MRAALAWCHSLFCPKEPTTEINIPLQAALNAPVFPVLQVKYEMTSPEQIQVVMNPHQSGMQEKIKALQGSLEIALWSYRRNKIFAEQRASRAEEREISIETIRKWKRIPDYQFATTSDSTGTIITITGGCVECTVACLFEQNYCDHEAFPDALKPFLPEIQPNSTPSCN